MDTRNGGERGSCDWFGAVSDLGPDTRSPTFATEARRQCERVNAADRAENMMDRMESVSQFDDDAAR
jgi:hypothetical protein